MPLNSKKSKEISKEINNPYKISFDFDGKITEKAELEWDENLYNENPTTKNSDRSTIIESSEDKNIISLAKDTSAEKLINQLFKEYSIKNQKNVIDQCRKKLETAEYVLEEINEGLMFAESQVSSDTPTKEKIEIENEPRENPIIQGLSEIYGYHSELEEILEATEKNLKQTEDKLNQTKKELAQSQESVGTATEEAKALKQQLETQQNTAKYLHLELNNAKEDLSSKQKELQTTNETLLKIKAELEQTNETLAQSQKSLNEFSDKNNKLKKEFETLKKTYSDLQKKYDTLNEASQEKTAEIDVLTNNNQATQKQLEISQQKAKILNKKIKELKATRKELEQQLQKSRDQANNITLGEFMPDTETDLIGSNFGGSSPKLFVPKNKTDSSSGNSSGPDETFADGDSSSQLSLAHSNSMSSLASSGVEDESRNSTLDLVKEGVLDAFKEENHQKIKDAFTEEFEQIATNAAETLFNGPIDDELSGFKDQLQEISAKEITRLISAVSNNPELLSGTIKKIQADDLTDSTYLEQIKNSASFIFENLEINQKAYTGYIADSGTDLLIELCIENLQTNEKALLHSKAKEKLEAAITAANLDINEHKETIKTACEELVTQLLEKNNIKDIIEKEGAKNSRTASLLEASQQKLQEQLEQQINQTFDHYFPSVQLDPIFQKIKNDQILSEEEIQKIPSELQYADTKEEFVTGLRVKYPKLPSNYESKINNEAFKKSRLILRKNSLSAIDLHINDNEIIDLDAEAWLETCLKEKLPSITDKPISLKDIKLEEEQENLLNELSSSLHLSTLYDIAIAGKTISKLTQEIEKASKAQASAAEQVSQIFQLIDTKQATYPKLIEDEAIAGFSANLNQHLENLSIQLKIDDKAAKILLMGINQRLKKDISKWDLLASTLQKEIAHDILTSPDDFAFDGTDTEKLVHHAMEVLRNNYPNDTVKKREQWLKDITLLHIATKKLLAFRKKIEANKAKFRDLKQLKEEEEDPKSQTLNEKISDVYLPKDCTIVADSSNTNLVAPQSIKDEDGFGIDTFFYKQNALKINQTLTFSQTLPNKNEQLWSVSRVDNTRLVYQTHKSWLDVVKSVMTYVRSNDDKQFNAEEEVLFTQLTHAVNSSKSEICKITISKNCSKQKERFIRCFIDHHNKNKSDAEPILECRDNDDLKMHKDDKINTMNKIKTASDLNAKEMENATKQSSELLNQHRIRPRGG